MEYGYIRVSTLDQNEDRQRRAMADRGIPRERMFLDKQSGKDFHRPAYARLLRRLRPGDLVVGAVEAKAGTTLLTITEHGYGKRTPVEEFIRAGGEPQHRGGFGLKGYQITEKTGKAAGVQLVEEDEDIMIISDDGTIIRMAAADVNLYSRAAQGVRVMRVSAQTKVIALARVPLDQEDEEETGAEAEETPSAPKEEG